uniref:Nucleotide-diphospho-sugar transferase domain-containing protein n=1 Tax=Chromera velia CCMP2878 TaxID=1169474 RepID=A0A0G4HTT0_9ALVE|eukprot:Cvel_8490.t1-p1 / transcript=Cvel_8490.t1 / gene=Cvel_8490 / organism=Chromera_velia_CCMP2878 / gene_product=hypothetical protein / transcript_product=hypothetical protein / location=Cvel_scaffold469:47128-50672(-) / protein_length=475 / sequence_SO=supercontig / SO=protein_coding / is_pseudo=false
MSNTHPGPFNGERGTDKASHGVEGSALAGTLSSTSRSRGRQKGDRLLLISKEKDLESQQNEEGDNSDEGERKQRVPFPFRVLLSAGALVMAFLLGGCAMLNLYVFLNGDEFQTESVVYNDLTDWLDTMEHSFPEWTDENRFEFLDLYVPPEGAGDGREGDDPCLSTSVLLTAGDNQISISDRLQKNRKEYAKARGYCLKHFSCRQQTPKSACGDPHYWRYLALWILFRRGYSLVLYLDLDTLITNFETRVEDLIDKFAQPSTSLILAADLKCFLPVYPLNNGVMLFRRSPFSQLLAASVLSKLPYRDALLWTSEGSSRNAFNAKGLRDQPLFTHVLVNDTRSVEAPAVLRTCSEWNDVKRPRLSGHWQSGDWIAHLSGLTPMAPVLREKLLEDVCAELPSETRAQTCPFETHVSAEELRQAQEAELEERLRKERAEARDASREETAKREALLLEHIKLREAENGGEIVDKTSRPP